VHSAQLRVTAAADGCTVIIPNIKDISSLQKIICRYRKQQQILTFLSLMNQDEDPGQKFPYFGASLMGEAKGLRSRW